MLLHQCFGVERNQQFFVGGDDHRGRRAVLADDVAGVLAVVLVAGVVNLVAEQGEVFHHGLADHAAVLADTAGEHERVDARECHGDAADFAGQLVAEGLEGDLCAEMAFACGLRQGAHVVRKTGEAEKAGFLVHELVEAVDVVAVLLADEEEDGRVEATGTGAHDEAVERGEAHGGVGALAVQNGGAGAAVAQVGGDEAAVFRVLAQNLGGFGGHEAVAGAVETVTADGVVFVELVWDAVEEGLARHGLVEGGVEYGHLRERREELGRAFHAGRVCGFVQRGEQRDAADVVDDFLRNLLALDVLAAMHHAVTDGFDRVDELLFGEELLDFGDGFGVRGAVEVEVDVAFGALGLHVAVHADIFDEAAGDGLLGLGIDDGELDRRTAAVENEYAHFSKQWLVVGGWESAKDPEPMFLREIIAFYLDAGFESGKKSKFNLMFNEFTDFVQAKDFFKGSYYFIVALTPRKHLPFANYLQHLRREERLRMVCYSNDDEFHRHSGI